MSYLIFAKDNKLSLLQYHYILCKNGDKILKPMNLNQRKLNLYEILQKMLYYESK